MDCVAACQGGPATARGQGDDLAVGQRDPDRGARDQRLGRGRGDINGVTRSVGPVWARHIEPGDRWGDHAVDVACFALVAAVLVLPAMSVVAAARSWIAPTASMSVAGVKSPTQVEESWLSRFEIVLIPPLTL